MNIICENFTGKPTGRGIHGLFFKLTGDRTWYKYCNSTLIIVIIIIIIIIIIIVDICYALVLAEDPHGAGHYYYPVIIQEIIRTISPFIWLFAANGQLLA